VDGRPNRRNKAVSDFKFLQLIVRTQIMQRRKQRIWLRKGGTCGLETVLLVECLPSVTGRISVFLDSFISAVLANLRRLDAKEELQSA